MENNTKNGKCPCGSGDESKNCCLPYILGQKIPETAEQLMRSRYTAYALRQFVYVFETWHPDYRPSLSELNSDSNPPQWVKLDILDAKAGMKKDMYGDVEFEAHFEQDGEKHTMKERSEFIKTDGRWLYTIGVNRMNVRK